MRLHGLHLADVTALHPASLPPAAAYSLAESLEAGGARDPRFPSELLMRGDAHVEHEWRAEAGHALAARLADTRVHDAVRSKLEQAVRELSRRFVRNRVQRTFERSGAAKVVERRTEVGAIEPHLETSVGDADLLQFPAAVIQRFRNGRVHAARGVPGPAIWSGESCAAGIRVAVRGHDHGCHWAAGHPLLRIDGVQDANLGAHAIVGPGFQLEHSLEIFGGGDAIEHTHRRKAARDETRRVAPVDAGDARSAVHQPRRASSSRRVCSNPSRPASVISVSAGRPPNSACALGRRTHRSASDASAYRMCSALYMPRTVEIRVSMSNVSVPLSPDLYL